MRVALVSCCGPKLEVAAPARDLYTSPLFRKSRTWAERSCDAWAILSAKHGLILPEVVVEPYDTELPSFPRAQYELWKRKTGEAIAAAFPSSTVLVYLAGPLYVATFGHVPGRGQRSKEEPLRGLPIGRRLSRLNAMLEGRTS